MTFFIASVKSASRNLHHISQHLSRRFNLSIAVTFYSSVKSYPVFSVTDTNFCDLMCQWLIRHALKVLYSLLSANTQNPYKSVLIHIQCVFNIIAVLRTKRVLREICIDIKVSVSDFLRMDYEGIITITSYLSHRKLLSSLIVTLRKYW